MTIRCPGCNDCYINTRTELLQKSLRYFLRHGVAHLSLRPLAAEIGTSARMLIHYFHSKELLIAEVMDLVQLRLQGSFRNLLAAPPNKTEQGNLLLAFWKVLTAPTNRASLQLLFEVQMLALQNPKRYRRYLEQTSASWRHLIEGALPNGRSPAGSATLYNGVIDGLLLDLLATGDLRRTTQALRLFVSRCASKATGRGKVRS